LDCRGLTRSRRLTTLLTRQSLTTMPAPRFLSDKLCSVRTKRERRKEARPGELLEAALDLFVEKGFAATRSEEVAARAGVSKGTLFLYFPSKEELFKAVVIENLAGRFTEWNKEFDEYEGSTSDMLRYCMRVWWERVGSTKASRAGLSCGSVSTEGLRPAPGRRSRPGGSGLWSARSLSPRPMVLGAKPVT